MFNDQFTSFVFEDIDELKAHYRSLKPNEICLYVQEYRHIYEHHQHLDKYIPSWSIVKEGLYHSQEKCTR